MTESDDEKGGQDPTKLFAGRWTREEEEYCDSLIQEFRAGNLVGVEEGATLRNYLAESLGCCSKRISKKYEGTEYNGRQQFWRNIHPIPEQEAKERQDKLEERKQKFVEAREYSIKRAERNKKRRLKAPSTGGGLLRDGKRPATAAAARRASGKAAASSQESASAAAGSNLRPPVPPAVAAAAASNLPGAAARLTGISPGLNTDMDSLLLQTALNQISANAGGQNPNNILAQDLLSRRLAGLPTDISQFQSLQDPQSLLRATNLEAIQRAAAVQNLMGSSLSLQGAAGGAATGLPGTSLDALLGGGPTSGMLLPMQRNQAISDLMNRSFTTNPSAQALQAFQQQQQQPQRSRNIYHILDSATAAASSASTTSAAGQAAAASLGNLQHILGSRTENPPQAAVGAAPSAASLSSAITGRYVPPRAVYTDTNEAMVSALRAKDPLNQQQEPDGRASDSDTERYVEKEDKGKEDSGESSPSSASESITNYLLQSFAGSRGSAINRDDGDRKKKARMDP